MIFGVAEPRFAGMSDDLSIQLSAELREQELIALYRQAFAEFGTRALWNLQQFENPTVEDALGITRALRIKGNMAARRLAERIEGLARAGH